MEGWNFSVLQGFAKRTGTRRQTLFLRILKYSIIPGLVPKGFLECSHSCQSAVWQTKPPASQAFNSHIVQFRTWLPPQFCTDTGSKTWTTGFETDLWFLLVVCGSEMRGAGPGSFCASLYSIAYPTSQPFIRSFNYLQKEASNIPPKRSIRKFPMNNFASVRSCHH
jgi:hypothetical protein